MNILFKYLYRDASNYKLFNEYAFSNTNNISLDSINSVIRNNLIDQEYFDPDCWGLPRLEFDDYDETLDHDWHEFEGIEAFEGEATGIDIGEFLKRLTKK